MTTNQRVLVGWNEYVDLPDWGVRGIHAKIDTGARSSALHVTDLHQIDEDRIGFHVHWEGRVNSVVSRVRRWARVTSSNGIATRRPFVPVNLVLGGMTVATEISLVDRADLRFPMLVGRTALAGHFTVDPGKRCLASRKPAKKVKKKKAAKAPAKHRRSS